MSATWPVSGGSGGSGDVAGPASSTDKGIASFSGTDGKTLSDGVSAGTVYVPAGQDASHTGGLQLSGAGQSGGGNIPANTGMTADKYVNGAATLSLNVHGLPYLTIFDNPTTSASTFTVLCTIRPDTSYPCNVGAVSNGFVNTYSRSFAAGNSTTGSGFDDTRNVWFTHQGWGSGNPANTIGYGLDASSGGEAYFSLWDPTANNAYYNYSFKLDSHVITVGGTDDATADANAAMTTKLTGANKTAGTGNGGDVVLTGGTSSGGTKGHVYVPAVSADPSETPTSRSGQVAIQFNTTNNKLWIYNGAWKSVTLA